MNTRLISVWIRKSPASRYGRTPTSGKDIVQPVIECFQIYSPREADKVVVQEEEKDVILAVEDQGIGIAGE